MLKYIYLSNFLPKNLVEWKIVSNFALAFEKYTFS